MRTIITVTAPSRLHFGLFALPAQDQSLSPTGADQAALPVRHFGGVGLMVNRPGIRVGIAQANEWSATGPLSARSLDFARQFVNSLPAEEQSIAFRIEVQHCPPEHSGLGVGTQLGLAVARAVSMATGHDDWDAMDLARRVGRGLRSSVGIHGFQHGGLLVEGGKVAGQPVAPLVARHAFPDDWQLLLIMPRGQHGAHGAIEQEAFAELFHRNRDLHRTEALCRLTLLGLLPTLIERDLPAFSEALYEFNHRAGEWFLPWQGGHYASAEIEERIDWLRRHGIRGVGQSSWGPTIFAVEKPDVLQSIRQRLLDQGELHEDELLLCQAANEGAMQC